MRNAKRMTAVFGSMLLAGALMTGVAGAQSSSPDATKDSTQGQSQQGQSQQGQQAPPAQPTPPAQVAPGSESKQSDSRTDYRSDTRSERIVETERSKFLGMDPTLAMIIGAVLFIVIVMAMVAMSRKSSNTTVETRRTI
jgi:preprotein translocase subunit SecG